jgi:hypothetical protein
LDCGWTNCSESAATEQNITGWNRTEQKTHSETLRNTAHNNGMKHCKNTANTTYGIKQHNKTQQTQHITQHSIQKHNATQ